MSQVLSNVRALDVATQIAEDVLFPSALQVDCADSVPKSHLDQLASAGLYGLAGPSEISHLDVPDLPTVCRVIETLAGGCLSTTFVWAQHHSAVMAIARSQDAAVQEEWLEPLCTGRRRAGLVLGSAVLQGPPKLRATNVVGGFRFDGEASWVSGWGLVDVLYASARDEQDTVVWALVDAEESSSMSVRPLDMVALQATRTVHVRFDNHFVPAERITATVPQAIWRERNPPNLRINGSLALGVTGRCLRLIGPSPLDDELSACRDTLDTAPPEAMSAARAAAIELCLRAAAYLAVSQGSQAVLLTDQAQRLMREVAFLLVFGSRQSIRESLFQRLSGLR